MTSYARALVAGLIGGAAATYAKTLAEQSLQPLGEKLLPPTPQQKTRIGADPAGHPENMPPSVMVDQADVAARSATGHGLGDKGRDTVGEAMHWVTGVGFAAIYALSAERIPAVRAGNGLGAGAALFGSTHASLLPATGFQAPLSELPKAWWVWEGGSHLVYGVALDVSTRAARALLDRIA